MGETLTKYEVLMPTNIKNLYKSTGAFFYVTGRCQSKSPEYIRDLLVKLGEYPANIKVLREGCYK